MMEKLEKLSLGGHNPKLGQIWTNPSMDFHNAQSELNFISHEISQDEFTTAFNQIAIAMEEGINLFEENDAFPVFEDDNDDLQLQNENGLNLEIGGIINLAAEKLDSINKNNENESRIEYGNKDFNIEELLQDD